METPRSDFLLKSRWRVQASVEAVAEILADVERLPEWWGDVYLGIAVLEAGDAKGLGQVVAFHSKGWLPYQLHWQGRVIAADPPHGWTLQATGDLVGRGQWRLWQDGPEAVIEYDWAVEVDRPWMRRALPILKPVFAWNHRWAMARGEAGLKRRLAK